MADDAIIRDKDVFEQAGAGLITTLALAASAAGLPLPVQGAIAMVGPFLGLGIGRGVYRAATSRFPAFAHGFLNAFDPDPVKAAEKAKAVSEEPATENLDDTMMRSFRQMMDAADESVVPILGYMAGLYAFAHRRPDAFFRGLGRLLCDLEEGDLSDLRELVRLVCTFPDDWEPVKVQLNGDRLWVPINEIDGRGPDGDVHNPHSFRIFDLLKREQLGGNTEPRGANYDDVPENPDDSVRVDIHKAKEIFRIVMPPGTKLPERKAPY